MPQRPAAVQEDPRDARERPGARYEPVPVEAVEALTRPAESPVTGNTDLQGFLADVDAKVAADGTPDVVDAERGIRLLEHVHREVGGAEEPAVLCPYDRARAVLPRAPLGVALVAGLDHA